MKYTVCYAIYYSTEVEANSPEEAAEMTDCCLLDQDDWEVTLVLDEQGKEYIP